MSTDLTFITNEESASLLSRFSVLIKDCRAFDVLVGYFFASGFHALRQSLENTSSIRILIGISTSTDILSAVASARQADQLSMNFSHSEVKECVESVVIDEFEHSEDNQRIEEGIAAFIEWIKNGKLQVRAYPTKKLHAKLYILSFAEGDRDIGRVITGSSNFTQAGLLDNLEFNVELKNRSDYEFALCKFNELWAEAADVSEKYLDTIRSKTWLCDTITPYELYLKFLYEYFKDEMSQSEELFYRFIPENFRKLEYQEQAVMTAKRIVEEYGGAFISDVVGLGKTYICAMLANQLEGRHLVIAPPVVLDENNPGSWRNVFRDFNIPATYESLGKLDKLLQQGTEKYTNVFIDEAHRFRNEDNATYEMLARICRGKRVILVTATPYNNYPRDILSQVKLFQSGKKSTIPNLPNLEAFFGRLHKSLKGLDRQKDHELYMQTVKENARGIREKVLKYLMVRRTRSEIVRYFGGDLGRQGLKFPEVADPEPVYYELDEQEDAVFTETIRCLASVLNYARYTPKLYLKKGVEQLERQSQTNMGSLMKILLVKRLDSSIYAFRQSIGRFIKSYGRFIGALETGQVYLSKRYSEKIFEMLENDDDEAIQQLIDEGEAEVYSASDFKPEFKVALRSDMDTLIRIRDMWSGIKRDAKLITFKKKLASDDILKNSKLLIFTESKETAEYLERELSSVYPDEVIAFTGGSGAAAREKVIQNFDARVRFPKDDYRILVSTEVLAEGVNLHRSNVVINYDIPWNPTRMMQRVGRINRVDTQFDTIYTFNFFPTTQSNDQIKLKEAAEAKINAFISMLGADARLLLEGEEIESHELFNRLISKATITGSDEDEESELKYLQVIRDIRDNDPDLFNRIKQLPKKARTARTHDSGDCLVTYFRKGKLQKFFLSCPGEESNELDFMEAAALLEATPDIERDKLGKDFYDLLTKNKNAFDLCTEEEDAEPVRDGSRSNAQRVLGILKAFRKDLRRLTEDQEQYLKTVISRLEAGSIPRQTLKTTHEAIQEEFKQRTPDVVRLIGVLQKSIPSELLDGFVVERSSHSAKPREVILSEYYRGSTNE
ncbi:MAG: helicase [Armatimonadetes bacterium]|nr:helicase [Armatimonadota bacterium]